MSVSTRSPLRMVGGTVNSGNVNTGEQNFTLGGAQNFTIYSGVANFGASGQLLGAFSTTGGVAVASGPDVMFYSGAGRLKDVVLTPGLSINSFTAGTAVIFYDAVAVQGSGPQVGQKYLGSVGFIGSGALNTGLFPNLVALDVPFQSGLCGSFKGLGSGVAYNVTFTPETNPSIG